MKYPQTLVKLKKLGTHTYTNRHITHIKSLTYVLMTLYVLYIPIHLHMETCRFIWLIKTKLYVCMFLLFRWTHTVPHPLRDARHILMKLQEHGVISAAKSAGRGSVDGVSQRERKWEREIGRAVRKRGEFDSRPNGAQNCYVELSFSPTTSLHAECTVLP